MESKIHTDWSNAQYEQYISGLTPGNACIAFAVQAAAHEAVVFGVDEELLRPYKFSESDIRGLKIQHEWYQSGRLRPAAGSSTAFFICLVEGIAGGIPRPEQKAIIMPEVVRRLAGMVKSGARKSDVLGRSIKSPFVPISDQNSKREAALDLLDSIEPEVR